MSSTQDASLITSLNDPRADIVLRSSDKKIFKVRRLHLQSGSRVFDDMLSSPGLGTVGDKVDGLDVVDLAERGEDLRVFLCVLVPSDTWGEELTVDNAYVLWTLAHKYDASMISAMVPILLRKEAKAKPAEVFCACAAIGEETLDIAKLAIAAFPKDIVDVAGYLSISWSSNPTVAST